MNARSCAVTMPPTAAPPAGVLRQPVRVLRPRRRAARVQDQGHGQAGRRRLAPLAAHDTGTDQRQGPRQPDANGLSVRGADDGAGVRQGDGVLPRQPRGVAGGLRQILPFVLHDKLVQDAGLAVLRGAPATRLYRVDRISWIRRLFDLSCAEYDRLDLDRDDPVADAGRRVRARAWTALTEAEVRARLVKIERLLAEWAQGPQALRPPVRRRAEAEVPAPALHQLPALADVEPMIGPAFARALEAERARYNTLFAQARRGNGRLDGEAFLLHLRRSVDPVVAAADAASPDAVPAAVDALYDVSLELVSKGVLGPDAAFAGRGPAVARAAVRRRLASSRKIRARSSRSLSNGLYNLATTPDCRAQAWVEILNAVAPLCRDQRGAAACGAGRRLALRCWRTCATARFSVATELPAADRPRRLRAEGEGRRRRRALGMIGDPWLDPAQPAPESGCASRLVGASAASAACSCGRRRSPTTPVAFSPSTA